MDNTRVFAACMIVSLVLIVSLAGALFVRGEKVNSTPGITNGGKTEEEFCKIIKYNGNGKINLVFFADKETAELYSTELMNFAPFDEHKEEFNVFYVDSYKVDNCDLYKNIATLCYSPDLVRKAALCGADYIIVIDDEKDSEIRSSSYNKVLSINAKHPVREIIAHEFGHAFAGFAEEYVPASLPPFAKNCKPREKDFGEDTESFAGCSKPNYYRSIKEGVLRTLANGAVYGSYNKRLIEDRLAKAIGKSLTGNVVSEIGNNCDEAKYYSIEFRQDESGIEEVSPSVQYGCIGIEANGFGDSAYSVWDEEGNLIDEGNFNSKFVYTDAPHEENPDGQINGEVFEYEGNFVLQITLDPRAETLNIQSGGEEFSFDISNMGARACAV